MLILYLAIVGIDKDISCLLCFAVVISNEHGIGLILHSRHLKSGIKVGQWNGFFRIAILLITVIEN